MTGLEEAYWNQGCWEKYSIIPDIDDINFVIGAEEEPNIHERKREKKLAEAQHLG